jgi:hypothetical protein
MIMIMQQQLQIENEPLSDSASFLGAFRSEIINMLT